MGHYLAGDDPEKTSIALATLCPTDRDTLAGTMKVLIEAQERVIKLGRLVTGADQPPARQPDVAPAADGQGIPGLDLSDEAIERMPVEHLAALQRVIELVATRKPELRMAPPPLPPKAR